MAKQRDIKRRIKSVKNTAKITHTMELVATAKARQCANRIQRSIPYFQALADIAGEARKAAVDPRKSMPAERARPDEETTALHPLLVQREVKKVTILGIAANRGLCGGYNGNVLRMVRRRRDELMRQGLEVTLLAVGRSSSTGSAISNPPRGNSGPRARTTGRRSPIASGLPTISRAASSRRSCRSDRGHLHALLLRRPPGSRRRDDPADRGRRRGEGRGRASRPLGKAGHADPARGRQGGGRLHHRARPALDPRRPLPLQAKLHVYRALPRGGRERADRPPDRHEERFRQRGRGRQDLRMQYNRVRQAGITKEILEIVGGAEALA